MGCFYRAFFIMIAVCAFHMPVFGEEKCPYMASDIVRYSGGGVGKFLKYGCLMDRKKWETKGTPLQWAVSGGGICPGNFVAVRDMLAQNSNLAKSKGYGESDTMLVYSIGNCCDTYHTESCGLNRQYEIARLLIQNGADVNATTTRKLVGARLGTPTERTMLDFVRENMQYNNGCKNNENGLAICKDIEKLLIENGARTYAELHPESAKKTASSKSDGNVEITPKDNEPVKTESAPVTQESTNVATVAPTESENTNTEQNSKQTEQLKSGDKKVESTEPKELTETPADSRNVVARGASNARSGTGTIRVSGVVLDEDGVGLPVAVVFFVDENGNRLPGALGRAHTTDTDGKFDFKDSNVPSNCKLQVGFSTYKSQIVNCGENLTINLEPEPVIKKNVVEAQVVENACNDDFLERLHAKKGRKKTAQKPGLPCVPTVCIDGYRLEKGGTDDAVCVEICSADVLAGLHALNGRPENNQCVPTGCVGEYELTESKLCCRSCKDNTNATCVLSMSNGQCYYETACKTGYETIVNSGAYNAYCTNAETYQVTLSWNNGAGGTQSKTYEYAYDRGITIEHVPTDVADGFRFLGWCENDANCDSPQSKIEIAPGTSGAKTYYAKFVRECSATELNNLHATSGNWIENQCVPTDCVNGYDLDSGVCVEICDANARESLNAKSVTVRGKICVPTKCIDEYKFDNAKNPTKCIWMCDDVDKSALHAKTLVVRDGKCVPSECESDEFILRRNVCVDKKLQEQVKGAEEEYASARENEMSLKNRLMSGATIGATGIGGMQLASGIAEQSADADAAADMAAYTQKMQCRVGGWRYRFNEKSVNVGGENALMGLYSEYVALADDLHGNICIALSRVDWK